MEYDITGNEQRVLSIYPTKTGFSFAYFEKATNLIDWGNVYVGLDEYSPKIKTLIQELKPEVVITEDPKGSGSRRGKRAEEEVASIEKVCKEQKVFLRKYSRAMIKGVFDVFNARNKYETSVQIASWFPELNSKLSSKPQFWAHKSHLSGIFDAVSFAIACFYTDN